MSVKQPKENTLQLEISNQQLLEGYKNSVALEAQDPTTGAEQLTGWTEALELMVINGLITFQAAHILSITAGQLTKKVQDLTSPTPQRPREEIVNIPLHS